jgi:hypothetical protein
LIEQIRCRTSIPVMDLVASASGLLHRLFSMCGRFAIKRKLKAPGDHHPMPRSIIGWFDLTKALAAAGFCISLVSLYFTWQNRRLTLAQEKRRLPRLIPTLVHGYYQDGKDNSGRVYAFRITVTNPTDSNNAIATAELSITYQTADRVQMTMKLRANERAAKSFVNDQDDALAVPAAVSAHNAISGWLRFHVPAAMLANRDIESYRLTLTDPHGETADIIPILVQEYRDET